MFTLQKYEVYAWRNRCSHQKACHIFGIGIKIQVFISYYFIFPLMMYFPGTYIKAQTSIYFWRLCCCVFLKNVISISISWHFSGCWNVLSKNTYTTKKGIYKALVIDRTFGLAELMGTTISQSFVKIGSKTKNFYS